MSNFIDRFFGKVIIFIIAILLIVGYAIYAAVTK
jgi:hypothetical protein